MYITPYLIDEVDDGSGGLLGLELGEHVALVVGARRRARHEREDTSAEVCFLRPFSIFNDFKNVVRVQNFEHIEFGTKFKVR